MIESLSSRLDRIIVDKCDTDWGAMLEIDTAAAHKAYEADVIADRVRQTNESVDAQWAVDSGWMSRDNSAVVAALGEVEISYDWDAIAFPDAEVESAHDWVAASRLGLQALRAA